MKSNIKILLVSPVFPFPEYQDGTRKIVNNLLKYLSDKIRFEVLTLFEPTDIEFFSGERQYPVIFHQVAHRYRSKMSSVLSWLFSRHPFNPTKYSAVFDELSDHINRLGRVFDLIQMETPLLLPVMENIQPEIAKKIILFPHDSMGLLTKRRIEQEKSGLTRLALRVDYRKILKYESIYYPQAQKVVFVSDVDARFTKNLNRSIVTDWIPNGVNIDYFIPGREAQEPCSLVFTGNMDYAPNADAALFLLEKIYPEVKKSVNQIRIYLCGRNPGKNLLKHHNGRDIRITGFVDDIRPFVQRASLFVSPLRYGSGLKNKVLEAMAMGKPVLASPVSSEGISGLENDRNIIQMTDLEGRNWAETIIRLLTQPENLIRIGKNARALVEKHYSWENICNRYLKLYESCLTH